MGTCGSVSRQWKEHLEVRPGGEGELGLGCPRRGTAVIVAVREVTVSDPGNCG